MTKKFWNDWQKRIGETKNIYLFFGQNGWRRKRPTGELNELAGDILLKAEFHGNAVDLIIERWHHTLTKAMPIENQHITLHREEIACIKFKKNTI